MPKYKHRQLTTTTHFTDNNVASESKYHSFKIKLLTDMMNAAFQQSGISGKYLSRDGMTVKSYDHNNPRRFIHAKPGTYGCKISSVCVQVGTASCTRMVDLAIVTAWLNYTQVYGTDAMDLLNFQHAAPVSCHKYTLSKSRQDDLLSLSASHIRVMPDVRLDGAGHI